MIAALALSLTIYAASSVDCPEPPAWPAALPEPILAECGTCLPGKLSEAIRARLVYLDAYPTLCRVAVNARGDVCEVEIEQAIKAAEAEALQARVEAQWPVGWTWWQVTIAVGSAALGGFAAAVLTTK